MSHIGLLYRRSNRYALFATTFHRSTGPMPAGQLENAVVSDPDWGVNQREGIGAPRDLMVVAKRSPLLTAVGTIDLANAR